MVVNVVDGGSGDLHLLSCRRLETSLVLIRVKFVKVCQRAQSEESLWYGVVCFFLSYVVCISSWWV